MPRLTPEQARQFLRLLDQVEKDMEEAYTDASQSVFSDTDGNFTGFHDKWGGPPSRVVTEKSRRKYRSFVERVYLDTESN